MLVEQVHRLIWKVLNVLLAPTQLLLMMVIKISMTLILRKQTKMQVDIS